MTGLQISYEKTEFVINIKDSPLLTYSWKREKSSEESFKYLEERIEYIETEKEAIKKRVRKMGLDIT